MQLNNTGETEGTQNTGASVTPFTFSSHSKADLLYPTNTNLYIKAQPGIYLGSKLAYPIKC